MDDRRGILPKRRRAFFLASAVMLVVVVAGLWRTLRPPKAKWTEPSFNESLVLDESQPRAKQPPLVFEDLPPPRPLEAHVVEELFKEKGFNLVAGEYEYRMHAKGPERVRELVGKDGYFSAWWTEPLDHNAPRRLTHPFPFVKELLRALFNGTWIHVSGCSTSRQLIAEIITDVHMILNAPGDPPLFDHEAETCLRDAKPWKTVDYAVYAHLLAECRLREPTKMVILESNDVNVADVTPDEARALLRDLSISANTNHRDHLCEATGGGKSRCPAIEALSRLRFRRGKVSTMLSYRWKTSSYDAAYDVDLLETVRKELNAARYPDVLIANSGIHAFHNYTLNPNFMAFQDGRVAPWRLVGFFDGLARFANALRRHWFEPTPTIPRNPARPLRRDSLHPDVCVIWKGMNDFGLDPWYPNGLPGRLTGRAYYRIFSRMTMERMAGYGAIIVDTNPLTELNIVKDRFHHVWSINILAAEAVISAMVHGCGLWGGIGQFPRRL